MARVDSKDDLGGAAGVLASPGGGKKGDKDYQWVEVQRQSSRSGGGGGATAAVSKRRSSRLDDTS